MGWIIHVIVDLVDPVVEVTGGDASLGGGSKQLHSIPKNMFQYCLFHTTSM